MSDNSYSSVQVQNEQSVANAKQNLLHVINVCLQLYLNIKIYVDFSNPSELWRLPALW